MFGWLKRRESVKRLDEITGRLRMNVSNNYKDAAQLNLKEFEKLLVELEEAGMLKDREKAYYRGQLQSFKEQMKNFTHKDQKPFWV